MYLQDLWFIEGAEGRRVFKMADPLLLICMQFGLISVRADTRTSYADRRVATRSSDPRLARTSSDLERACFQNAATRTRPPTAFWRYKSVYRHYSTFRLSSDGGALRVTNGAGHSFVVRLVFPVGWYTLE